MKLYKVLLFHNSSYKFTEEIGIYDNAADAKNFCDTMNEAQNFNTYFPNDYYSYSEFETLPEDMAEYITTLVTFDKKDYSVTGIHVYMNQGFHAGEIFDDTESFVTVCRSLPVKNLSKEKIIDAAKLILNK